MEIPINLTADACSMEGQFTGYESNQMAPKCKHRSKWCCKAVYEYLLGGVACDQVTSARRHCVWW
jgi:hypothetical protein